MARSKRRPTSRKRKMRGDWVYRGFETDGEGGPLASQVASYIALSRNTGYYTVQPGTPLGVVLYDSVEYLMTATRSGIAAGTNTFMGREARAEGRKATALAVDGHYYVMPNAWTLGSNWALSARIVVCDQNTTTGGLDLPAAYNLGDSLWANGWGNLVERRDWIAFATGNEQQRWKFALSWKGRRSLKPHECLALYIESSGPAIGSTTLLVTPVFRSLMHDPNS